MKQTNTKNRRLVLAEQPKGAPTKRTLNLETEDVPSPQEGEILLRTEFLSLDPYMGGRMSDAPSYAHLLKSARHLMPFSLNSIPGRACPCAAWFRNTTPPVSPKVLIESIQQGTVLHCTLLNAFSLSDT